ncbi:MAG: ATP-binding protein [Bacteroidota bacterium]
MREELYLYRYYNKVLLIVTIVMIGLILGFFMLHSYQQNLRNAEKSELKSLHNIAKTLALSIDGSLHEKLVCNLTERDAISKNSDNKTYEKIHRLLKQTQLANDVETPIYTLFKKSSCTHLGKTEQDEFLFGISSTVPFFRHRYESFPEYLHQNFDEGGTIGEYYDDHGHWLSAFAPVKNRLGKTVAVVQVDASFCSFVAEAKALVFRESIYAMLFLFLLAAGFIFFYRKILKSMSEINTALENGVSQKTIELHETNTKLKHLNEKLEKVVTLRTKELEVANNELKNSNEKLKAFARVSSHDLRAPLRSIGSFAQLIKRRYKDQLDEDGLEYLQFIFTNVKKMSDLIQDILSTSLTPEENRNALKWVNLNEVLDDVKSNLSISIKKYKVKIQYYNLPIIQGYHSEFIQLFQNLISNSIKYSRDDVAPAIKIVSHQRDDSFLITVSDNGRGISEENLKKIFNEFERGSSTDGDGYGIGLATCKRIIKEYHGTLKVSSKLQEGTCFFITLKNRQPEKEAFRKNVEAAMSDAMKN